MTEDERQELEALRLEKRQAEQRARAREVLEGAGVPASFAPLLAGENDGDTGQRAEAFCAAYQAALAEDVRRRLPQRPPEESVPAEPRARRGVRRIR